MLQNRNLNEAKVKAKVSELQRPGLGLQASDRLQHAEAGVRLRVMELSRTRCGLVLTVAALRHGVHPVLTQRCLTFCEVKVNCR